MAQPAPEEQPARNWFVALTEVAPKPSVPPVSPRIAADKLWQAASVATARPQPAALTSAGLPQRKPGARVLPAGPQAEPGTEKPGFRDPESIRSNLSRHYDGVRAARQQTRTRSEAREDQ